MSDDAPRPRPKHACDTCKARKKKCNRGVPACSYCVLRDLECRYAPLRPRVYAPPRTSNSNPSHTATSREAGDPPTPSTDARPPPAAERPAIYRPLFEGLDNIHLEVQRIIQTTGEFVDDLTSRYFQTLHRHLPIISRSRFQRSILATGSVPSADTSILLLTICLNAYIPKADHRSQGGRSVPGVTRQSLYLTTKALLAQVHGSVQPSVSLLQASILLAVYEYASGKTEVALATVAGCARMAYAAGIHISRGNAVDATARLEALEAWNTWWGTIICERAFMSEAAALEQPLATSFPPCEERLPIDRQVLDRGDLAYFDSIPDIPVSAPLTTTNVGGFARAAQASGLLDRIFKALVISDLKTRIPLLDSLDQTLQSVLGHILSRGPDIKSWHDCTALSLNLSSLAALDTVTTMVIDMAKWHCDALPPTGPSDISPMQIYVVHAALEHLRSRSCNVEAESLWPAGAKGDLRRYLARIRFQWVS
ncbi:hypothetical protein BJY00DRAFT_302786 [Aspergillus carlsbadensis]|nr:hypothetical protein BJY00DRAFT_302786 [Aspergillus carlsbadensis]